MTVEEIFLTSVGGVARARARGDDILLRDGDRLADGEVDGIDVFSPAVAWLRFRRRMDSMRRIDSIPGIPYRPVVWLLVTRGSGAREVLRLDGELLRRGGFPPWIWEIPIERAPHLVTELLESSEPRRQLQDPGHWLHMKLGFGNIAIRFASRDSLVRAMAAGGPAPSTCPEPRLAFEIPGEEDSSFAYDPGPRRDPFADLSAWTATRPAQHGCRQPDVSGLLIDEIDVEGLFRTPWGAMAEVRTLRDSFFLREGDQLYDGDVVAIDLREGVRFRQIVQDPTSLKPFRQVVRRADPRWIAAVEASGQTVSPPSPVALSTGEPADRKAAGLSWIDAILAGEEEIWDSGGQIDEPAAGRRDPFRSLVPGGAPAARPPSKLARLSCSDLTAEADQVAGVLERADRRLARYVWERGLIADHRTGRGSWAQRFLDDIAQTASLDLARLIGELPYLGTLRTGLAPPPAEMFAVLGDLNVVAGRLAAAIQPYRIAEQISPGQKTLCGHWYDGKLYVAESFVSPARSKRWVRLTGYLLAWDPASDRIVERHLLPVTPKAFAVEPGKLRITLPFAGLFELAGQRPTAPVPVSVSLLDRWAAIQGGTHLAANFTDRRLTGTSSPFELRRHFDHRLPLDLPELERAARAAAVRDPTQPWHPFILGQALWAQGRRAEAETLWRGIWDGGPWAAPYYERLWMAVLHEAFGQRAWADRGFARALAQRRRLAPPIAACHEVARRVNTGSVWLEGGLRDPERRYLWWRRLREISGAAPGDAFRAALWAADLKRRGDDRRAHDELAYLARTRRAPFDRVTRSAWLDYSFYGVVACAAMTFAWLAALGGRMVRHLMRRRLDRRPAARVALRGLPQLLIPLSLFVALPLAVLAANSLKSSYLIGLDLGDIASAGEWVPAAGLLRDWATKGVVNPVPGPLALLERAALEILIHGAGAQALLALAGFLALFVIALPAGLLLGWGRARAFVTRWIPGAAQVTAGARLRGYAVFGLFVFAVVPLAWLVVARVCGAVPAPGLVSANAFLRADLEGPLLPLSTPDTTSPGANFARLRAERFVRLLFVYPGAGLFWSLVAAALAVALGAHARTLRSAAPPARAASSR